MPTTLSHGTYGRESKFEITQHGYAGAGAHAYIELLEVKDAPENKPNYLIHQFSAKNTTEPGHNTWNFASLDSSQQAWDNFMRYLAVMPELQFESVEGYIDYLHQSSDTVPWYYEV